MKFECLCNRKQIRFKKTELFLNRGMSGSRYGLIYGSFPFENIPQIGVMRSLPATYTTLAHCAESSFVTCSPS